MDARLEEKVINGMLTTISIAIWFTASVGNFRLFQYSKRKWIKTKASSVTNTIFYILTLSNLASCLTAIPVHIVKMILEYFRVNQEKAYLCLARYSTTMLTTDLSLMFLTALIVDHHDKIVLLPYGKRPRINNKNKHKYIVFIFLLAFLSNLVMFGGYIGHLVNLGVSPCRARTSDTLSRSMTYVEGAKTCIIAVPCLLIMFRYITNLRRKIQTMNTGTTRMHATLKKIRQTYYYILVFLIFWVPFGVMAVLAEELISKNFDVLWFNIAYTVAYGYILGIPLVCAITDKNFHYFQARSKLKRSSNSELGSENTPSVNITTVAYKNFKGSNVNLSPSFYSLDEEQGVATKTTSTTGGEI